MEYLKRLFVIIGALVCSTILINYVRDKQQTHMKLVPVACFTKADAEKLKPFQSLKYQSQIKYETIEEDGPNRSYECYFAFPKASVVCAPRDTARRKNLQSCPNFPSIVGTNRLCYFLDPAYHSLAKVLSQKPHLSYKAFNGTIVRTIPEAKKILSQ